MVNVESGAPTTNLEFAPIVQGFLLEPPVAAVNPPV